MKEDQNSDDFGLGCPVVQNLFSVKTLCSYDIVHMIARVNRNISDTTVFVTKKEALWPVGVETSSMYPVRSVLENMMNRYGC